MPAFVHPAALDGSYQEVDREGDPSAAPGAVVTRNASGNITDVDLDAADRWQAQKGFDQAAEGATDYASGWAD